MSLYTTKVFLRFMKPKPHTALGRLFYIFVKILNEGIKTLKALDNVLKQQRCQLHALKQNRGKTVHRCNDTIETKSSMPLTELEDNTYSLPTIVNCKNPFI